MRRWELGPHGRHCNRFSDFPAASAVGKPWRRFCRKMVRRHGVRDGDSSRERENGSAQPSGRAPEAFTTLPHFAISLRTNSGILARGALRAASIPAAR